MKAPSQELLCAVRAQRVDGTRTLRLSPRNRDVQDRRGTRWSLLAGGRSPAVRESTLIRPNEGTTAMHAHAPFLLRVLGFQVLVALALGVTAAPGRAQDLRTAYQQAAATSPVIAQARAQLDADLEDRPLARAALLPRVDALASGGINTAHDTGFSSTPISTGYHSDLVSATLTQSIFDGQAFVALGQADSRIRASQAALASAEQSLVVDVTQAYFGVLHAQAGERVAEQQVTLLQTVVDQTRASLRVGVGDIISVQEAQAQLDGAKADLIAARNGVAISKAQLERLTHAPVGTLQDVTVLQAAGPQPDTLDPWLETALKNQPLLREARAALKTSEAQVQFEKRARWPTLTLSGTAQHAAGMLIPPLTINQVGASLNLSIPILDGGRIGAKTRRAEALTKASRANVLNVEDQIRLDTQTAFLTLQNSVAHFEAAQQSAASARLSMEATRKGYEIGTRSIVDLLTTTTNYGAARRDYDLALYTNLVARIQLKAAAGVLTPLDIESINSMLR
jgi:outer membrane protein